MPLTYENNTQIITREQITEESDTSKLYIVVSQTGTILSRFLKMVTRAKYNHVSVSLEDDLHVMYSFGRRNPYNPVWGGFVMESPENGTFARFTETEVVVLCVHITQKQKQKIKEHLESMYSRRKIYHYNYLGLLLAAFHICYKSRNHYYCSEFVKDLLVKFKIFDKERFGKIVHPTRFLKLENADVVYRGKLRQYSTFKEKYSDIEAVEATR